MAYGTGESTLYGVAIVAIVSGVVSVTSENAKARLSISISGQIRKGCSTGQSSLVPALPPFASNLPPTPQPTGAAVACII